MNRLNAVLYMQWRGKVFWLLMPWIILGSSFVVNIIVGLFMAENNDKFYSGGITSIFIYMLVIGIITLTQSFPFALGLSVRRTDYFLGTTLTAFIVSVLTAIILSLLSYLEADVTNGWGVHLHFFKLPYLNDGSLFQQLAIYLIGMFHIFFLGFVIASLHRRHGKTGMTLGAIIALVAGTVGTFLINRYELWDNIFNVLRELTAFQIAIWLLPLTVCYMIISFLFLRRATV
ncbi:hypothetical protein ACFPYJ_08810 [Paenibacillus solisilvae]|uniref:ABC transporter permease n=1 Tax=Paenibacillus solisilvae TaxID=2486751 RepID=A0ABW0VWJ3_9BACL